MRTRRLPVPSNAASTCIQCLLAVAAIALTATATALPPHLASQDTSLSSGAGAPAKRTAFPLKASANKRYLVDQNDTPFLMIGDSPQALIANLSLLAAEAYMANRRHYGINTLWINILCKFSNICNRDGTTFDGIAPFLTPGDLSTPNPEYFKRVDDVLTIAARNGFLVLLDPIETGEWLDVLRANGVAKAFAYGEYLGKHFRTFSNIIWMHGNDFQSWRDAADDAVVQAVALGIKAADPTRVHTVELNYPTSGSLDDPSWAPIIELDAAYTYFPSYAQVLSEYNHADFKPVFLVESTYEFEQSSDEDSTQILRRQEYWAALSGAAGQLYGSFYTWRFGSGWESHLDTPGIIQLSYLKNLLASRKWYDLIPDQDHVVVTQGYNSFAGLAGKLSAYAGQRHSLAQRILDYVRRHSKFSSAARNTYVTAARTADGSLVMAYLPTIRTITVDMAKLSGLTTARWYDPTSGRYIDAGSSRFANVGTRSFVPPGRNADGDGDWVLVLETSTVQ